MIAFATLFLGLVLGSRPVEVAAGSGVASVEFVLDGVAATRLSRKPWRSTIDFGSDLSPHELVARALDADGREIAAARQWLNLPRAAAELQILLDRNGAGVARTARLVWESLLPGPPQALSVTLDGRPLPVSGREPFSLPAYDPATTHVLSAAAEFENGVRCRADAVLGGQAATETASALTAIAVRVDRNGPLPDLDSLKDGFVSRAASLRTVAVERGSAQVLIVRDPSEMEARARYGLDRYAISGRGLPRGSPEAAAAAPAIARDWAIAERAGWRARGARCRSARAALTLSRRASRASASPSSGAAGPGSSAELAPSGQAGRAPAGTAGAEAEERAKADTKRTAGSRTRALFSVTPEPPRAPARDRQSNLPRPRSRPKCERARA